MSDFVNLKGQMAPAMSGSRQLALKRIVDEHGSHLRRFVSSRLTDASAREDVVQEVYLRLASYEQVESLQDPRPFIFRIAENLIRDRFRRHARHQTSKHELLDDNTLSSESPAPDQAAEDKQELARVREAILVMPEPARTAFVLSRFEDMSYREIAGHMGVTIKTVEKYISVALAYLRETVG